jgi:hypothetical protein
LFVDKNPPAETTVIERLSPLNNLTPEKVKRMKIIIVINAYKKKIFNESFLMFISGFKLLSEPKTNLFSL